jgi:hypothetical protein
MAELATPFATAHEKALKSVKMDQANGQKECAVFVNGTASPRSPSPAGPPLFSQQKAAEVSLISNKVNHHIIVSITMLNTPHFPSTAIGRSVPL